MTEDELKAELKSLNLQFDREQKTIMKRYADANNPYKIGDVVEDYIGKLRVARIGYYFTTCSNPCCIYYGVDLKKNGEPAKRQTSRGVYQMNIKTENEK